ncbi:MAG: hypothetical protein ACP5JG_10795 [Anaerolineae bacterium]
MEAKQTRRGFEFVASAQLEEGTYVAPTRSWESFPKPCGWSLAWDEHGLNHEINRHNHHTQPKDS